MRVPEHVQRESLQAELAFERARRRLVVLLGTGQDPWSDEFRRRRVVACCAVNIAADAAMAAFDRETMWHDALNRARGL